MVGLAGASKLGLINKMPGVAGDKFAKARKAMTSNSAMRAGIKGQGPLRGVTEGITKLKRSDLPTKRNMKSIFVQDDGSIIQGNKQYMNKDAFKNRNKNKPGGHDQKVILLKGEPNGKTKQKTK